MDFPTDEVGDGTYTKTRIDALKKVLREKDKENIAYMNQCILLRKQVEKLKKSQGNPSGHSTVELFEDKLRSQQKTIEK